jgi:hypothetical protein
MTPPCSACAAPENVVRVETGGPGPKTLVFRDAYGVLHAHPEKSAALYCATCNRDGHDSPACPLEAVVRAAKEVVACAEWRSEHDSEDCAPEPICGGLCVEGLKRKLARLEESRKGEK